MFPHDGNNYIVLESRNTCSEQSLLCCRACLASDCKLFNIHEYKLADDLSRITGTAALKDKLPEHLCSYCRAMLLKCASFRDMCFRTQQLLMTELLRGELNIDHIKKMNQPAHQFLNLTIKVIETINCNSPAQNFDFTTAPLNDLKVVESISQGNTIVDPVDQIKDEPNIDIVDINNIIKTPNKKIKFENKTADFKVSKASDEKRRNRKAKIQTRARRKKGKKKETEDDVNVKTESVSDDHDLDDVSVKSELNIDNCIDNKSVGKKRKVHKEEKETIAVSKRRAKNNRVKCDKSERKEKEEIMKNKSFEIDYSVQIVILSKDEQLAEIAARKGTRNYLESQYKCEECYKGFDAEAAYNNHVVRHSPSAGAFVCEICRVRFPKNYMRTYHQDRHRLKILCTKCEFISRTKTQATQHHAVHEGRTYVCTHCGKSFQKRSSHLSHVRLAHPERNVACDACGEVFVGVNGLKMHKAKMHSEKIKCTTCSAKFVSLAALNRHTDTAGDHRDLRPCEQCGENCASETALQEHVRETHITESRRCKECKMEFPSPEAYSTHVSRSHLQQRKSEAGRRAGRKPALPGKHMCEQCGRILPSPSILKIHQRTHQGVKPFSCNECSKAFTTKEYLVVHLRSHSGEKPFQCPSCPLAFTQKGNFLRHHKTAHLGVRESFPCPYCGSMSTTRSSLRVHIDSKHGGRGWPRSRKRANTQTPI